MYMKKDIIQKIRKTKWWQAEGPSVFQLVQPPFIGFTKVSKYYPGLKYWGVIIMVKNDYGNQFMSEEDSVNWIKFLIEKDKKNKKYIQNKIKKWRQLEKKLISVIKQIGKSDLSKIENTKLCLLFDKFYKVLTDTWAIPIILEGKGIYFEKNLIPKTAKESNLQTAEAIEKLSILVTPEKPSFAKKSTAPF